MNTIEEKIKSLEGRGTTIVGLCYEDSKGVESIRNVRLGDKRMETPPFGKAINSSLFTSSKGETLIRGIDHTKPDAESFRVFRLDRIKNITVDGEFITADTLSLAV